MPPHTTHLLQPLDVGVFNSYKAAYRRAVSDPALDDIFVDGAPEAVQSRLRMLARSLIANLQAMTTKNIRRAFYHTGIYPPSFAHFLHCSKSVRDVPVEVSRRVEERILEDKQMRSRRAIDKGRRTIVNEMLIVTNNVE